MAQAAFWQDKAEANKVIAELKLNKSFIDGPSQIEKEASDIEELLEAVEAEDEGSLKEIRVDLKALKKRIDALEFKTLLKDDDDPRGAILSINAGAGGTESCDWAAMLSRMYSKWAQVKGFQIERIDFLPGEEAGIKNITSIVRGEYAYGYLKAEEGVHRLVRISPFDSNKRRHTSFASVDVIPQIDDSIQINVNPADLRIDTFRAGGCGGQHVNVTDSAVRITHVPSGIVVQCQNERSQHKNKSMAMKVLRARLYEHERKKKEKSIGERYEQKGDIAWGNQIRSYVLHPYQMVKDHRTDLETSGTTAVLDGDIDGFIEAYLKKAARG